MKKGRLTVIAGCMFAGKTTLLIKRAEQAKKEGKKVEVFYPVIDTRYKENAITTHSQLSHVSKSLPLDVNDIPNENYDLVIIDELHFFDETIVAAVEKLLENGVDVILGGLDNSFRAEPFPTVSKLISLADESITLEAKCVVCGKPARFTQRTVKDDETLLVGGAEMYEARCEEHYVKPN